MSDVTTATIRAVERALARHYGEKHWDGPGDPLAGLVGTILSQSTSDVNSGAAFAVLTETFPTWEAVAAAPEADIAAAIRSGGLAEQKAGRIKAILQRIEREQGRLSLDALGDMSAEQALEYLSGFKGVGPKTAACVLLFDLGRPVFPVDTHVHRIALRLGWLPEGASAQRAHQLLGSLVPPKLRYSLHVNLIAHGRALCRPTRPKCGECPVAKHCVWVRTHPPEL